MLALAKNSALKWVTLVIKKHLTEDKNGWTGLSQILSSVSALSTHQSCLKSVWIDGRGDNYDPIFLNQENKSKGYFTQVHFQNENSLIF